MSGLAVGARVAHLDMLAQDGRTLPMRGTVVAIATEYIVRWDNAEPRPASDWTPTHRYPADVLKVDEA